MNPETLALSSLWSIDEVAHILQGFDVHSPEALFELDELCRLVAHLQRLQLDIAAHVEGMSDVSADIQTLRAATEELARAAYCLD